MIDKAIFPRDKLCGGAMVGWGEEILKKIGVEIVVPSVPIKTTEFLIGHETCYHREIIITRVVRRYEFDHALIQTAVERGLELHEDEAFIDMERKGNYVIVKTSRKEYKVQILIGADGSLSRVRRKLNLSERSHIASTIELFAPIDRNTRSEFSANTAVFDFSPLTEDLQGYIWHFPCLIDGIPAMNHGICDCHIHPDRPRADMKRLFIRSLKKRGILSEKLHWSGFPLRLYSDEATIFQPNILLVGDAAGTDPAGGAGILTALAHGEVAAMAIIAAVKRDDFSLDDYKERLLAYPIGKWLRKNERLAKGMYSGGPGAVDAIKEAFYLEGED